MQKVHIRHFFRLYVPLACPPGYQLQMLTPPNSPFGFVLKDKAANRTHHYQLELFCIADDEKPSRSYENWATWAKRNPICFQTTENDQIEGVLIRIKVNHGVFDFRKLNEQLARIALNYSVDGIQQQRAASPIIKILPKRRTAADEDEVCIPINWEPNTGNNDPSSLSTGSHGIASDNYNPFEMSGSYSSYDSPDDQLKNSSSLVVETSSNSASPVPEDVNKYYSSSPDDYEQMQGFNNTNVEFSMQPRTDLQYIAPQNENYMVLYNGNAEVVGNFRALNFYKSSDINIKEDIRLLVEDHNCRDTLLQIDGVNYKFKKGVHADTNRRFVGYIAQQVESVVPEAVQLIDGILHVDYESLIPYLSESMKQNYNDIKDVNAKADRIQQAIDSMYEQFVKKEDLKVVAETSKRGTKRAPSSSNKGLSTLWKTIILISIVATCATIGLVTYFVVTQNHENIITNPPSVPEIPEVPLEPVGEEKSTTFIALKDLYQATNGPNWKIRDNWLNTSVPFCQWFGVKCKKSAVVELNLASNNLVGSIPESFSYLGNLTLLNLTDNSLEGSLPLVVLEISDLRTLYLGSNKFDGTIPKEYTQTSLVLMDLGDNRLTGTIPDMGIQLAMLELNLSRNKFTGTVPDFVINHLDLSHNQLEGTLKTLGWSTTHLNLSNNRFYGSISSITDMSHLALLDISYNDFNGTMVLSSEQLTSLKVFDISHTKIKHLVEQEPSSPNFNRCDASDTPFICPLPSWATNCKATCASQ